MKNNLTSIHSFDGTKIFYKKELFSSKNPTVIFLHGFGGDLGAWSKHQDILAKNSISSLAIDLRGHGYSDRSNDFEFYNLQNFVNDILYIIEHEKICNPIIVGHCFGGMVSLLIEQYKKDLSKGLVLISTSYKTPYLSDKIFNFPFAFTLIKTLSDHLSDQGIITHNDFSKFNYSTDLDFGRFVNDISILSPKSYFYILENLLSYNVKNVLNKIKKPTLILQGEKDIVIPSDYAKYLNNHIKKSKLVILKNEHHVPVLHDPVLVSKEILDFVVGI